MNILLSTVVKVLSVGLLLTQPVLSEEKICAPFPCGDRVDYVTYSRDHANIILIGSFSFSKTSKRHDIGASRYMEMTFTAKEILKGVDVKRQQKIQVPISGVVFSDAKKSKLKNDLFTVWTSGRGNLNGENWAKNYQQLEQLLSAGVKNGGASSANLALVDLAVGGLDYKVRETAAPIFEGQDYVFFLFKDYISGNGTLFPWEFNVIPYELHKLHK